MGDRQPGLQRLLRSSRDAVPSWGSARAPPAGGAQAGVHGPWHGAGSWGQPPYHPDPSGRKISDNQPKSHVSQIDGSPSPTPPQPPGLITPRVLGPVRCSRFPAHTSPRTRAVGSRVCMPRPPLPLPSAAFGDKRRGASLFFPRIDSVYGIQLPPPFQVCKFLTIPSSAGRRNH